MSRCRRQFMLRQACPERSRRAQHERIILSVFETSSVRPEPVEACPEPVEGGERSVFRQPAKKSNRAKEFRKPPESRQMGHRQIRRKPDGSKCPSEPLPG